MKTATKKIVKNIEGFTQSFANKDGKVIHLKTFLKEGDWWELKNSHKVVIILTHDAIKRISDEAGIRTDPDYTVLTQPSVYNNYQSTYQVKICDNTGRCSVEIGESNKSNLGPRGRNNPANMAQKRAYDRAVLRHLGIIGTCGEDELPDEEDNKKNMDKLSYDEQKAISTLINEIINAKNKKELTEFKTKMKKLVNQYTIQQVEVLRNLWKKSLANLEKTF